MAQLHKDTIEEWGSDHNGFKIKKTKKLFFGRFLCSARFEIEGTRNASDVVYESGSDRSVTRWRKRKTIKDPTLDEFTNCAIDRITLLRSNTLEDRDGYKLIVRQRVTGFNKREGLVIYDCELLYNLYRFLRNKPEDIHITTKGGGGQPGSIHIYANSLEEIETVREDLGIAKHLVTLVSVPDASMLENLLEGKEYSAKAPQWKYKVFLKPVTLDGLPDLYEYLREMHKVGVVDLTHHCACALVPNSRFSWSLFNRSYMYAKDEDVILIIKMMAPAYFSGYIELVPLE